MFFFSIERLFKKYLKGDRGGGGGGENTDKKHP